MRKKIAIVILNYNGVAMLERFLPAVLDCSEGAHVVVADNCSTDNSIAMLRQCYPEIRVIEFERNWGFAEGYNRALDMVKAEYYVLLNSDVEVTDGWLDAMTQCLDNDKSIVACQPKLLDYKRKTHFEYAGAAGGFIDRYGYPFCRGRIFDTVEPDNGQYDKQCDILWATGAALMVRADEFHAAGGFDGRYFAHMEEVDLCWRLRSRGKRIVCVPQSVVYHIGGATLNYNNPRKTFLNFRNNLLTLYKNLPEKDLHYVMFVRMLLDYVAAFKFLLGGSFANFKAVLSARWEFHCVRHLYRIDRMENLYKAKKEPLPQRMDISLLWRYYVKKADTFKKLLR
ncbi:MAG: glycosyltransferase family 2 protein [Bacteroidaceae bacterium]|nr:glycosyltransferase family 2 protein [Bacteroidaceae bacterium]MBR7134575.1 glycosyltransferase family 2 protein [Bacteroidaceae bacterium]